MIIVNVRRNDKILPPSTLLPMRIEIGIQWSALVDWILLQVLPDISILGILVRRISPTSSVDKDEDVCSRMGLCVKVWMFSQAVELDNDPPCRRSMKSFAGIRRFDMTYDHVDAAIAASCR